MRVDKFNVRVVHQDNPLVEFYDSRYPHTEFGQFVSCYYVSTILESDDRGLCLDGGVPDWSISAKDMAVIRTWLKQEVTA